jgi:hypothetical protein
MTRTCAIGLIVAGAAITYVATALLYGPRGLRSLGLTFITLGLWGLVKPDSRADDRATREGAVISHETARRGSYWIAQLGYLAFAANVSVVSLPLVAAQSATMVEDVAAMVRAAHQTCLMPWCAPVPESDSVVRHGKAVVPRLMALLPDDPDDPSLSYSGWDEAAILAGKQFDWNVEQQAAVVLCKIYSVPLTSRPRYDNRASRERNRRVKAFFAKTVTENP